MCPVRKSAFVLSLLALLAFGLSPSLGQAIPKPAKSTSSSSSPPFDKKQIATLLAQLKSDDQSQVAAAKTEIEATVGHNKQRGFQSLAADFLPQLLAAKKYDIADELARFGIVTAPYVPDPVRVALEVRIQAALARQNPQEALKYARSLFNVATMEQTAEALLQVESCLKAAYPDQPDLLERFRQEQIRGSHFEGPIDTPADQAPADKAADTGSAATPIIKTLPADSEGYLGAADTIPSSNNLYHFSRGNLFLMASRPEEARKEFEAGLADPSEQNPQRLQEGIARAIKAQDGLIGRANAYILSADKTVHVSQDLP